MTDPAAPPASRGAKGGLFFGFGACASWGLFPAFFPLLKPAGAPEVLAQRIVWMLVVLAAVLLVTRQLGNVRSITRGTWWLLVCAAALISVNGIILLYALNNGYVVDAALGYFINPLVSVVLGMLIYRERLNRFQTIAVGIAVVAVAVLSAQVGSVPFIAIGLALSFGLYGAVKKAVPTDPRLSVGIETAMAAPFAIGYLVVLQLSGHGQFTNHGWGHIALTVLSGPVTAIPLLMFAAAAQRLPLVTLGLMFYLTPAMQMAWGVVVGHEPMPQARWVGFALIWVALAVFSTDALRRSRSTAVRAVAGR